jgi:hypothetical protein
MFDGMVDVEGGSLGSRLGIFDTEGLLVGWEEGTLDKDGE